MTNDKAIHAAILAGFKRANIGRMHFRMAAIIEAAVADRERERCANACDGMVCTMAGYENMEAHNSMAAECASRIRAMNDEVTG